MKATMLSEAVGEVVFCRHVVHALLETCSFP